MDRAYFIESNYGSRLILHAKDTKEALRLAGDIICFNDYIILCEEVSRQELIDLHVAH
jgi:hypothetical protein